MLKNPFMLGALVANAGVYAIATRGGGDMPNNGPLVYIGLSLMFTMIGIGAILDFLWHIAKKLKV